MQIGIPYRKGVLLGKILPLAEGMGEDCFKGFGKLLNELDILGTGHPAMAPAEVFFVIQQGLVVGADIK